MRVVGTGCVMMLVKSLSQDQGCDRNVFILFDCNDTINDVSFDHDVIISFCEVYAL